MELLKFLSVNEVVAQTISFLILLFILRIFAWKKLLKLLDERRERIAAEFKNIEDAKAASLKLQVELEDKLKTIDEAAKARINEAVREGQNLALQIKKEAHQEAQKIIEDARSYTKYELSKVKEELKTEIVDLVMKATEDIIEERVTAEDDRRIVESFLDQVDKV